MSTECHNKPKSSRVRSHHISSFASLLLLTLMMGSIFFTITHPTSAKNATAPASFGFTYTGDYDQKAGTTTKNLQKISQLYNTNQISFNLGLGDYSYASTVTKAVADSWSTYAKNNLPANFPFEILDGRHDSSQISEYEADLPDHLGNLTGTYGQQYYFDYSVGGTTLARFIMISPNQTIPGYTYNYDVGGADYTWVQSAIQDAQCVTTCSHPVIPWVIVGMHEYCFVIGTAACKDQQLLDMLLNNHVDLILQAQKHNYQASDQLALNTTTCTSLNATAANSACIVPYANPNTMTKGAGSVIMVTGTGGASQLAIDKNDPKYGYFRTSTPTNNVTWGISQFSISATQLSEQFVPTSGGTYTDSFTISNTTATPTPTATTSPSATATPFSTPMPSLGQDNFTRPNQTYWGTATDGQSWGANANSLKVFSIKSNTGQVVATTTTNYYATLGPPALDAQVQFSGSISSFSSANLGAVLRWADSQNWYEALIDGTNLTIEKKVAGTITKLKSVPFAATPATSYTLLFSITGTSLSASVWPSSGTQPATWMATATDTSLAASGSTGLHVVVQSGVTVTFTAYQANSLP